MLSRWEADHQFAARALALKSEGLTSQHSAAEAAVDAEDDDDAKRRRREHIQHEVDPYLHEAPGVAHADLGKAYDQAVDVPEGYPPLRPVHAEQFRRGRSRGEPPRLRAARPGRARSLSDPRAGDGHPAFADGRSVEALRTGGLNRPAASPSTAASMRRQCSHGDGMPSVT